MFKAKRDSALAYCSNHGFIEMQNCMAEVCKEQLKVVIQGSPYIGLMLDESCDIAVTKKLVIFCKVLVSGDIKTVFSANVDVLDGKSETIYNALVNFLQEVGVNFGQISGIGTDGANVMVGRVQGVGVKMKNENPKIVHVWCAPHRLALVAHWAASKIEFLKTVQETLVGIYNFYSYSPVRYNKIRELQKIMKKQVKRFKKTHKCEVAFSL